MSTRTVTPPGGQDLQATFVQRVAAGVRYAFTGKAPEGWFGPGLPVSPVGPPEEKGRQWDYQFAVNQAYRPRSEAGETAIDFRTLRRMAEPADGGLDLLRLAIETRKDQMAAQRWSVQPREKDGDGDRAALLTDMLREPDGEHDYLSWQRMLLEDLFVIDAPTVYLRESGKGYFFPEVVDGATIKRILNEDGRTPLAPDTAYQQDIKGLPAFEYTTDELIYAPRNLRSHRIYGMSPVEQVVMTVDIALNRQVSQLVWFTEGTIPSMFLAAPKEWTPAQVKEMQDYYNATLAGNLSERSRLQVVPGGSVPQSMKEPTLKDLFDEWLARIICYAFSLSPQALVREMNRSTAETGKQQAAEEGLEPLKLYWRTFMNRILARAYHAPDMQFSFEDEEISDPTAKATAYSLAVGKKAWLTVDEAREAYGKPPATPEQAEQLTPPAPPAPFGGGGAPPQPPNEPPDTEKLAKALATHLADRRYFRPRTMTR